MASSEREAIDRILLEQPTNTRLFRINAGAGWVGDVARRLADRIVLRNPRLLHAAPEGWPDLCGWQTVTVTPEMVGTELAVFTAIEVKTAGVRLTHRQRAFLSLARRMGALVRIVRVDAEGRMREEQIPRPRRRGKTSRARSQ